MVSPNDSKTGFYTKLDGSYVKVQYIYQIYMDDLQETL